MQRIKKKLFCLKTTTITIHFLTINQKMVIKYNIAILRKFNIAIHEHFSQIDYFEKTLDDPLKKTVQIFLETFLVLRIFSKLSSENYNS